MVNRIGPIILDGAINYDGVGLSGSVEAEPESYKGMRVVSPTETYTRSEQFAITIPTYKYQQLLGLIEQRQIVYIDGSSELSQEHIAPKGWYILQSADIDTFYRHNYISVSVNAHLIDRDEHTPLELDYTTGVEDGTTVEHGYGDNLVEYVTNYQLNENFNTYDTANIWYSPVTSAKFVGDGVTPIGGALNMIGKANSNGATPNCYTSFRQRVNPPFYLDFGVEWTATPTNTYYHFADVALSKNRPTSDATYNNWGGAYDWLRLAVVMTNTGAKYQLQKNIKKKSSTILTTSLGNSVSPLFRLRMDADLGVTLYADPTRVGTFTKVWGKTKTGVDVASGVYLTLGYTNLASTVRTVRFDDVKVYRIEDIEGKPTSYSNVVPYPSNSTPTGPAPDFTRTGVDCTLSYCVNPSSQMNFVSDQTHIYDGSVKAYSSNNTDTTPRQVFSTDEALDNTFNIHNSLIKVEATPTGVNVYAATSPTWTLLNTFNIGTGLYTVKVNDISPDHATIQFNDTYWEMYRGKPHLYITHPTTPLTYIKKDYYVHDAATLTTPANGVDVTMTTNFYTLAYNLDDTNRLMILQKEPTTLKTNSIPATETTGIGYYPSSGGATPTSWGFISLAKQWVKRTETKVRITRP